MIRAIILDDEQPSVDKLERLLIESGMVEIKGKFTEPIKAVEFLKGNKVDAVFLDIEMPDMDGIELSNRIVSMQEKIAVVFVTAYNQYAVEAFRLNALDFLMKPVTPARLKETLERIIKEKAILVQPVDLKVQCFGKFKASAGNSEVKFRTEKAEELLAFLIDQRGSFVSRNRIIDSLWEEYEGDRALIHFNTTLHYVKRALVQHGVQIPIEFDRGSYRFDVSGIDCDYCRFHKFTSIDTKVNDTNLLKCEEAARLYTGEYLSGKESAWVERSRQMQKDRFISLLLELSSYYKGIGMHMNAVEWLKIGLDHEPLHRELNFRLIEALLLNNDRISALRYHDIYKKELKRKMNREPDEGFRKLIIQ